MKKVICTLVAVLFVFTCAIALVACNKVADNTEHFDSITKSFKLEKDYAGKSFLTDGIGVAKLSRCTDGDTTNFRVDGQGITIRYYMIDTPESTGSVEKWGHAASAFNASRLEKATEIVLESSTGGRPEHDSYGVRWLGYVWYKCEGDTDFKCLNLELVENGYTENKGQHTDKYPYWSYFNKAESFAKGIQLRIWSKLDDPDYSSDPVPMTIKGFWENTDAYYNSDNKVGSKVQFEGYFTSLTVSKSGTFMYVAEQYDPATGETYQINVYAMYGNGSLGDMKIGQLYDIIGTVQLYNGSFQISDITYSKYINQGTNYTTVKQKNYYLNFDDSNPSEYRSNYSENFYGNFTVESVTQQDGELTIVGSAKQVTKNGFAADGTQFTVKVKVPASYNNTIAEGSVLKLHGLQLTEDSGVITVLNFGDITVVSAAA